MNTPNTHATLVVIKAENGFILRDDNHNLGQTSWIFRDVRDLTRGFQKIVEKTFRKPESK